MPSVILAFMSNTSLVQPALLSKINERQVLRTLRARGPQSRAEVARHSGISAPTASRAVESLLRAGLLEEGDAEADLRGRPARKLRLASETVQVLGLVIDASQCRLVAAGLDGRLHEKRETQFQTPPTYEALIAAACDQARALMMRPNVLTLGMAISMPGLIDYRQGRGILSPNVPLTNQRSPSHDLTALLGVPVILVQESHALCLAERHYGAAKNMNDFAMIDVSTGIGLGVMSGGRLLTGHAGIAGEVGHITVELEGRLCGCGNQGCLETVASDAALAYMLSQRLGRKLSVTEVLALLEQGELTADAELDRIGRYLAIGLAAVINLFNPSTLFVHSRLFSADKTLLHRLIAETGKRALPPSFADCRIVQARGSKRQGAIAAIIDHLTESVVPVVMTDALSGHSTALRPRSSACA
jgi:predicted NBD/HSP70 family sugar kinase